MHCNKTITDSVLTFKHPPPTLSPSFLTHCRIVFDLDIETERASYKGHQYLIKLTLLRKRHSICSRDTRGFTAERFIGSASLYIHGICNVWTPRHPSAADEVTLNTISTTEVVRSLGSCGSLIYHVLSTVYIHVFNER